MRAYSCNLCQKDDLKVIFPAQLSGVNEKSSSYSCTNSGHGEFFQLVQCQNCGLFYSSPRIESHELDNLYGGVQDEVYKEELQGRLKTFSRNLRNLEKHKSGKTLLDVGSNVGAFLSVAKNSGWDVTGIEPSRWCIDQAKKIFGLNENEIQQGHIQDLSRFSKKWDAITLWDVLEHLDDPLAALTKCKDALKPDGILALSTVDIGSLYAKLLGKRWPWLMKMHIFYFNRPTMKKYLEKAGLELLEFKVYTHTVSYEYLLYKLKSINRLLHQSAYFFKKAILFDKNIYVNIALGDFMEVYAVKK